LGDGFFAVHKGHGRNAIDAAIGLQLATKRFNETFADKYPKIRIGVGLHSGIAIAGTVGTEDRVDGSIVGDTVNTASRVEGLTKHFGAQICVTEAALCAYAEERSLNTRQISEIAAHGGFEVRFLGLVKAKGKSRTNAIYEVLIPGFDECTDLKIATKDEFEKAWMLFTGAQTVGGRPGESKWADEQTQNAYSGRTLVETLDTTPLQSPRANIRQALKMYRSIYQRNPGDKTSNMRSQLASILMDLGKTSWEGIEAMSSK
jgi:Adenylate and Guanylate cyclase catalytic domain